ncbi:MAG: GNAT family N-acetyltransferase [Patescibacteria group bacterium]|jgi:ribosomal protein S18 acetylase RimI-like enzyme
MEIRAITLNDYERLIDFWRKNYFVNEMDNFERFKLFLEKNPNLSVLCEDKEKIIGTALGSFDGRRGYLQKVVTDKTNRKKGVGKQIILEVIKRLRSLSVLYIPISCEEENVGFYEKCGFKKTKQIPMNMNL